MPELPNSFHAHRSWGRTRQPKNLNGAASTAQLAAPDGTDPSGATDGYATENQRFLHVTVSAANNKSVKIYVYNYAIGIWAPLMVNDGDGSFSQATATTAASATANLQPQTFIFEIAGADRVAFVTTDTLTVHAACTTF